MKYILLTVSSFLTITAFSQAIPIILGSSSGVIINYQKHKGYITLVSGETIEGNFQYGADEFPTYNLKSFSENGKKIKRYKSNHIKTVILNGSDTTLTNKDSTYFKVLDKSKRFYRQLTFGSIEVYDNLFNVNEKGGLIRSPLVVKANNKLYKLNSKSKFIKWMKTNYPDKVKWHENITVQEIIRQLNGMQ